MDAQLFSPLLPYSIFFFLFIVVLPTSHGQEYHPFRYCNTLNDTLFAYNPDFQNLTLYYDCPDLVNISIRFPPETFRCGVDSIVSYANESFLSDELSCLQECQSNVTVPVLRTAIEEFRENRSMTLEELLDEGFHAVYKIESAACLACVRSDVLCWIGIDSTTCVCCSGAQRSFVCQNRGGGLHVGRKIAIGFGGAGISIILMCLIFFIYHRRFKKRCVSSSLISRNISSDPSSMMDLEKSSVYFGVPIFSYNELEKATNNFDIEKELGDGGFGTVYQGKLQDGRDVAVKRLYENNFKRVEQFMNEVEILTRLRHKNLVALYGCTSRHCRELLLVYEYVPNGTVADHLHGDRAQHLRLNTRMTIAIETASALTYLHASDVIHRDVKTNNILLDNNFSVKVADFGLSRLFPMNVTHVSTAPQGTPGYVDPEYHECYQLTDKSDVYSFGVVLIELISSKPAVDIARHRHEINLSNMAINKILNRTLHELVDPSLGFESDYKVRRMITDVAELAFRCLQNGKEMRPSMEEVLEVLKRIQCKDYHKEKAEEMDLPADDVVLLKNNSLTLSPNSVTANWASISTTPNTSG